jgi:AbrB family looped-hinge helix DNA binding protein
VTSKLQVTIPRTVADELDIRPGDEIEWQMEADMVRIVPPRARPQLLDEAERLRLFDQATARQRAREAARPPEPPAADRGWTREELYRRGSAQGEAD